MPCGATQDGRVTVERSDRMWSTGEGNGKPLQYSCLENPMNSNEKAKRQDTERWTPQVGRCPISYWRDWGQEEKEMTKDEMTGWHHWLNGNGFGWTLGVGDGHGGLVCCGSWGCKELDTTKWLNWTELSQSYGFSSSHVWIWELDYKEGWAPKNWCFWTVVWEKDLASPLHYKQIKPVNPKGNQSWIFIGRTDAKVEASIFWPPDAKSWLIRKEPDAGKYWRQEEKRTTEDKMVGWHHRCDGHDFEQPLGDGEGQGSLVCCSPWYLKESDMTEWLNNNNNKSYQSTWHRKCSKNKIITNKKLNIILGRKYANYKD